MNGEQMTELLIEHTAAITKNTADVKELFHRVQTLEHCFEESTENMAKLIAENREQFNRIETIENLSGEIKSLTESVHSIALSTHDIKGEIGNVKGELTHVGDRLGVIENDKRQKNLAVWQVFVSALLGGGLTLLVTKMLGG